MVLSLNSGLMWHVRPVINTMLSNKQDFQTGRFLGMSDDPFIGRIISVATGSSVVRACSILFPNISGPSGYL